MIQYWLMKSEPHVWSFAQQQSAPEGIGRWEGVRNYQARNYLRAMRTGDRALFYHSSCTPPHVAGVVEVVRTAYADPTQFDPASEYYDPTSPLQEPRWSMVDVQAIEALNPVTLDALRGNPALEQMVVLRRGNRLSITPVTAAEFEEIVRMGRS